MPRKRLTESVEKQNERFKETVEVLLRHPLVRRDRTLMKIFRIIEKDEPSHWAPYENWLLAHGKRRPTRWERAIDTFIHSELLFVKLPLLFVTPKLARRINWADTLEPATAFAPAARPMVSH